MANRDVCAETAPNSLSLPAAREHILDALAPVTGTETLPLKLAGGRVLAEPLSARFPLPPFANSAMDGYALDAAGIPPDPNAGWQVVGSSFAGRPYVGTVVPGQCVRIFTGAPMPDGTDTVIMQEHAERTGDRVRFTRPIKPYGNVRPAGDELATGQTLVAAGKRLTPPDLGLIASAGFAEVTVVRKLRLAYFSTGDELTPLGEPLHFGRIYDSNRYLLQGLLDHPAIEATDLGVVRDDRNALRDALNGAASWADAILTSGGVSVGEADFIADTLREIGQVNFWKIALKPGKPFAFGRIGRSWLFGLPGNPVAVLVAFHQLVKPGLLRLMGADVPPPLRLRAVCRSALRKQPGRMEFQRGIFCADADGELAVTACGAQGSHQLSGASAANCLIVLAEDNAGVRPGETVLIEPAEHRW